MVFSEQVESCCPGFSDLELTVTGGTPPFEYDWENGVTVPFLENVDAGDYEVKVTDSEGCYQERTFTVEDIAPPTVTIDALIGYACDYERNGEQVWHSDSVIPREYRSPPGYCFRWATTKQLNE